MYAIVDPTTEVAAALRLMIEPTASMPTGTPQSRAFAAWGLIVHEIERFGPSENSRGRNALRAAFRLHRRQEITEPWEATLGGRFAQLKNDLGAVFGNPVTTTPIHKAWADALTKRLVPVLTIKLRLLAENGSGWAFYADLARRTEGDSSTDIGIDTEASMTESRESPAEGKKDPGSRRALNRLPSEGAQPVFMDLMVTTVIMKHRTAHRRITERLITSKIDGLTSYVAVAVSGTIGLAPAVRAVWGCRAVKLTPRRHGEPVLTKLVFPRSLRIDEKHFFSSEAIDNELRAEREGVDVEVDHHGIAPGELVRGHTPVRGLTIRVQFDEGHVPAGCWWHAEQTVRDRRKPPPADSDRWLPIVGQSIEHTFVERCHPREVYGVGFLWD
ncbi:hypothetical protein [Streptomyces sp. SID13031]|uniref:hypothetical protein n=1 Tax=Streptomyces sp. SID13031 TaxID=2706046 RepID=UPI0013CD6B4E|nr:hypothetical protein [Streptomyces sp. SID13031]NEA33085.1 hypothetical protein [Streptomyces sp. SID13031]